MMFLFSETSIEVIKKMRWNNFPQNNAKDIVLQFCWCKLSLRLLSNECITQAWSNQLPLLLVLPPSQITCLRYNSCTSQTGSYMSLVTAKSPKAETLGVHEDKLCIRTSLSHSDLHVRVLTLAPLHNLQLSRSSNWAHFASIFYRPPAHTTKNISFGSKVGGNIEQTSQRLQPAGEGTVREATSWWCGRYSGEAPTADDGWQLGERDGWYGDGS